MMDLSNTFHDNGEVRVLFYLLREQTKMFSQQFVSSEFVGVSRLAIIRDSADSL